MVRSDAFNTWHCDADLFFFYFNIFYYQIGKFIVLLIQLIITY
jgi:hypothetical protein